MKHPLKMILLAIALALPANLPLRAGPEATSVAAKLPPLPEGVTSFAAATLGDFVYVSGGHRGERHDYNAEMVSGSFHRLNLKQGGPWERLPGTTPAQGVPLVAHEHFLYRTGGMAARNKSGEKQDLWSLTNVVRFNTKTGLWKDFVPLPEPRSSHDAVVIGNLLYVGGGWNMLGAGGKLHWFDHSLVIDLQQPQNGWQKIPQPFQRRALALAQHNEKVFFIGGMDSDNKTTLAVEIFNPRTRQWTKGPSLPDGKSKGFGCSAINQNGRLFANAFKGDLLRLGVDEGSWEIVGRLQTPRLSHRIVTAGSSQILALGGEDGDEKCLTLEVLSPSETPQSISNSKSAALNQ